MIISRTPFRISFAGGGSDFPEFYRQTPGAVISTAIDKYMFIMVTRRFDHTIRVSYSKTETVPTVDELEHPIVRETLRHLGLTTGLEIVSIADIPARTGLGSSSSFTVGLLHALYTYKGQYVSAERLAAEACHIEIEVLKEPIGKQDQYIAAYGGLQMIQFNPDETVFVDPVICAPQTKTELGANLMMFWTGTSRRAADILEIQRRKIDENRGVLAALRDVSSHMRGVLVRGTNLSAFGELLHEAWLLKRRLADGITTPTVDEYYERAREAGALGGKLLGAGAGGFLMLFVERQNQSAVRDVLAGLRELPFGLEAQGSKIVYVA